MAPNFNIKQTILYNIKSGKITSVTYAWEILPRIHDCCQITTSCMLYCRDSPDGIDLVLDSLCGEDTKKGITLLKPMGRYILYGK